MAVILIQRIYYIYTKDLPFKKGKAIPITGRGGP
jgi:hypothetical protein